MHCSLALEIQTHRALHVVWNNWKMELCKNVFWSTVEFAGCLLFASKFFNCLNTTFITTVPFFWQFVFFFPDSKHVGYKNRCSTCDHRTLAEFQTKNLADLQLKYYRAAQAGISICCLYTLCFEISVSLLTCSKITTYCSPKPQFEVHLNWI